MKHRQEEKEEPTEYAKLLELLRSYEKILHPDIFNPIIFQIAKVYEESRKEGFANAKISPEALRVEKLLNEFKERKGRCVRAFNQKILYKELLLVLEETK